MASSSSSASRKWRAVCLTDKLHFLLLYAQRAAILIPSQIVQIKYYTWAIIKRVLVATVNVYVVHLRLQNGSFAVSFPGIAFFFFNCTMALINGPGNLILLAFDIGIDLYSCWKYSECIFALIFTGFHRFTEYLDLEGAHITQWRDYRVQLLSKWPIWGLIPQSWCYKYHALISWAKFVGCWTQTAIDAYFGYIQAIWCSLGFCTK